MDPAGSTSRTHAAVSAGTEAPPVAAAARPDVAPPQNADTQGGAYVERYPEEPLDTEFKKKYPPDKFGEEASENARIWKIYREEATVSDRSTLDRWNKTLDVLLIFAGLFSAVSTAFIVESYKLLQVDNTDYIAHALFLVLSNRSSSTVTLVPPGSDFRTLASSHWVNGLWFSSLILSLTAALFSILAKQWLDEYNSRVFASVENELHWVRRHAFYNRGLSRWSLPEFIALLPVILHVSLFLFLAGLAVFLWQIDRAMGTLVLCTTLPLMTFYIGATGLPLGFPDCPTSTAFLGPCVMGLHAIRSSLLRPLIPLHRLCEQVLRGTDILLRTLSRQQSRYVTLWPERMARCVDELKGRCEAYIHRLPFSRINPRDPAQFAYGHVHGRGQLELLSLKRLIVESQSYDTITAAIHAFSGLRPWLWRSHRQGSFADDRACLLSVDITRRMIRYLPQNCDAVSTADRSRYYRALCTIRAFFFDNDNEGDLELDRDIYGAMVHVKKSAVLYDFPLLGFFITSGTVRYHSDFIVSGSRVRKISRSYHLSTLLTLLRLVAVTPRRFQHWRTSLYLSTLLPLNRMSSVEWDFAMLCLCASVVRHDTYPRFQFRGSGLCASVEVCSHIYRCLIGIRDQVHFDNFTIGVWYLSSFLEHALKSFPNPTVFGHRIHAHCSCSPCYLMDFLASFDVIEMMSPEVFPQLSRVITWHTKDWQRLDGLTLNWYPSNLLALAKIAHPFWLAAEKARPNSPDQETWKELSTAVMRAYYGTKGRREHSAVAWRAVESTLSPCMVQDDNPYDAVQWDTPLALLPRLSGTGQSLWMILLSLWTPGDYGYAREQGAEVILLLADSIATLLCAARRAGDDVDELVDDFFFDKWHVPVFTSLSTGAHFESAEAKLLHLAQRCNQLGRDWLSELDKQVASGDVRDQARALQEHALVEACAECAGSPASAAPGDAVGANAPGRLASLWSTYFRRPSRRAEPEQFAVFDVSGMADPSGNHAPRIGTPLPTFLSGPWLAPPDSGEEDPAAGSRPLPALGKKGDMSMLQSL